MVINHPYRMPNESI